MKRWNSRGKTPLLLFSISLLALVYSGIALGQMCPPQAPYAVELEEMLVACPEWSTVVYDPALGYLPENDPETPWERQISTDPGAVNVQVTDDGHLSVGAVRTSGIYGVRYNRSEPALADPGTALYVMQVKYQATNMDYFFSVMTEEEYYNGKTAAIIGATDPDDLVDTWGGVGFNLSYQAGNYFIGLAGAGVGRYAVESPWNEREMTYTLVVDTMGDMHLYDGDSLLVTRPFAEVGPVNMPTAFTFASADLVSEFGQVSYCVCHTPTTYNGEAIDNAPVAADMIDPEGRLAVTGLTEINKSFVLDEQFTYVVMDVTANELPGDSSGQFEYVARLTWTIEDYDTGELVGTLQRDKEVSDLGTMPLAMGWTGYYIPDTDQPFVLDPDGIAIPDPQGTAIPDPQGTAVPDPSGPTLPYSGGQLMYKATVQLLRTKVTSGKVKLLGEVSTDWRSINLVEQPETES